jgi:hypothetical protein
MKPLTDIDIEQIILMAWGDTIPFETIKLEYGLTENQVRALMRKHQTGAVEHKDVYETKVLAAFARFPKLEETLVVAAYMRK